MRLAAPLACLLGGLLIACAEEGDDLGGAPWRLEPTALPETCEQGPAPGSVGAQFILVDAEAPAVRVWASTCCWPVPANPVVVIESLDGRSYATELVPLEDFFGEMTFFDATVVLRPVPSRLTIVLPVDGALVVRPGGDCLDLGAPAGAVGDSVLLLRGE